MKTLGLIAGMSWESSISYYQIINQQVALKKGGLHSADIIMHSVDFAPIAALQHNNDWQSISRQLSRTAVNLENAGADAIVICTNTMHKVAQDITESIDIPLLHIADCTAEQLSNKGITSVGLLGTRFTMEDDFYADRLRLQHGIDVVIPNQNQRRDIHQVIYQELCVGQIQLSSRLRFLQIISDLAQRGAQAIVLGCTEIGLLINQDHTEVPLFDTTEIHAKAAATFAMA